MSNINTSAGIPVPGAPVGTGLASQFSSNKYQGIANERNDEVTMYVEQVNVNAGSFKEAMNASAAPVSITGGSRSDFMNSLEHRSVTIDNKFNSELKQIGKRDISDNPGNENIKREEHRSISNEGDTPVEDRTDKAEDNKNPVKDRSKKRENHSQQQSEEKEKAVKQENTPDGSNAPNDKKKVTKNNLKENVKLDINQKVKELAKSHHVNVKEIKEVKEGMEENFREAKSIDTNNNLDKLMLKSLEDQNNPYREKTGNQKSGGDEKTAKEPNVEYKQQEPDIEIKESRTTAKQEVRVDRKDNSQTNSALNLLNNQLKEIRQINDIQVKKEVNQHQSALQEQYQELRDRVTGSVENGIKFLVSSGENKIVMQLQPPELGRVQVELVIKDNQVNAKINTENTAVREVIMTNLDQLKSNLENAGTQVNKFDVEVGGFRSQFDQQFAQEKSSGKQRGKQGSGNGQSSFKETKDPGPGKVWNHHPLSFSLGRSINCLI